jgi:uncharacterized repeat protein (TIGR02059 family)
MIRKADSLNRVAKGRVTLVLSCSILMLLASVLPAVAALVRQPYLQLTAPTSVTIVWRTNLTCSNDSRVEYGISGNNLTQIATGTASIPLSNSNVKDHIVMITGLSPGTQYFYNVGTTSGGGLPADCEGGGTTEHFFVTAPSVGTATPFTAWFVGDSGSGSANQVAVRDAMLAETGAAPPNLFLHAGDIAYIDGTDAEFTSNHFGIYQSILRHTPLWPTLGNHEARSVNTALGTGPYYEAHVLPTGGEVGGVPSGTEAYYSFDYANAHFIVLDSMDSDRAQGSPMLTWLQADLSGTAQEWVIALFHHPPYTKGTHDSDSAVDSGGRLVDMRETVLPILEAGGVDLVLGGHSHIYERSYPLLGAYGYGISPNFATPDFGTLLSSGNIIDTGDGNPSGGGAYQNGTVYMVAGHGGNSVASTNGGDHPVMFFSDATFGSVLLDVNGSTLTARNLRSDGVITDLFAIDHSSGGSAPAITSPTPGSTLATASVTFEWSAGSGVDEYYLGVGTSQAAVANAPWGDLFAGYTGTNTSQLVSNIPINGNPTYVRLWWRIGSTWSFTDSTYQTQGGGDPAITSPTPGSTLTASPVVFQWSVGSGVDEYWLQAGTTPGNRKDLYDQSAGLNLSASVSTIPINGNPVYVRLWWRIGSSWFKADSTYQTQGGGGDTIPPVLTTGTVMAASLVLSYDEALDSGSIPATTDFSISVNAGAGPPVTDVAIAGTGVTLTLASGVAAGDTVTVDYTVGVAPIQDVAGNDAANLTNQAVTNNTAGGGDPAITSPTPGSTLTASPVVFQWSVGSGVDEYWLQAGTTPGNRKDLYDQSAGLNLSASVSTIPINGNPVYVRLWWRIGSSWFKADSTYQTQGGGGVNFTAYNDLAWGVGQLNSNITTITSPNGTSGLPSSGQLIDFSTGLPTPVILAVTGGSYNGTSQANHGADPAVGTDAHGIFNGIVSGQGTVSFVNQAVSSLVLTLTGLDPTKVYDLDFYAHRNNYAWARASLVTISGQDAFTNISSTATDNPSESGGVLFTGSTDSSTRLPSDNDNGYVARFSNIDPGSDGLVVLTISYDGSNPYKGKYGSAVRLVERETGGNF